MNASYEVQMIPLNEIAESPLNPRKTFLDMDDLVEDVKKRGILQPVLVRPLSRDDLRTQSMNAKGYELVFGARRFRAAKAAKLEAVPAMVRPLLDDEALEIMIVENCKRADIPPLEEAEGYRQLMKANHEVSWIADRVGRSVNYVYDSLKLLSLTKEAQKLFREGLIQKGHAVLLSRLKPADQERAIGHPGEGPLLYVEKLLWDPEKGNDRYDRPESLKAISARELQAWIDENVRFDRSEVEPMLFPATAQTLAATREVKEKIVPITYDHFVQPEAKVEGERTFGPMSWKRADGKRKSKTCDRSVTGVIVVGPGRGGAFKVCVDKKKCATHWGAEQRAAAKRAKGATADGKTGEDRWQIQQRQAEEERKRQEAERERWKKATPAILAAMAAAVKKAPTKAGGLLASLVLDRCALDWNAKHVDAKKYVAIGTTAENLVRHAAFLGLIDELTDWDAPREFPKRAKAFGIDVKKIVDEVAPAAAEASQASPASAPKKPAKKGARKK